jgi:hypothetical protein
MGGPDIKTRFGRKDAKDSSESVESQVGWFLAAAISKKPVDETKNPQTMVVLGEFNIVSLSLTMKNVG